MSHSIGGNVEGRKDDYNYPRVPPLDRRQLIKLGAGVAFTTLTDPRASAQAPGAENAVPSTHAGWKNDSNRSSGNGKSDDTTREIVDYVTSFSESQLTDPVVHALGRTLIDSMAALVSGFESEPARIGARLARSIHSDLKCTVLGYGVTTSPELAAFTNGCMMRHTDFNDLGQGGHNSDIISGILAIGEALHSTGPQVLVAIALGYELLGALYSAVGGYAGYGWDAPFEGLATAMAVGKLMKLTEDQLANALSITLVPHMPMQVTHVGTLSHWKGCHSGEAVKCAVWATLLAREGMTGPCQPFEGRTGLFDHDGRFKESLRLPAPSPDGRMVVQRMGFKRTPSEGSSQAILEVIPAIRAWTKAEDIASIHYEMPFRPWQEIADPPKWDPRNPETADHSLPYLIARALIDGEIYLDSYAPQKFMDPVARSLMEKITIHPVAGWSGLGPAHITVRTKTGSEKGWDTLGGDRNAQSGQFNTEMSDGEIAAKFDRACAYMSVANAQRDRARTEWANLRDIKDISMPIHTLANFGRPLPL